MQQDSFLTLDQQLCFPLYAASRQITQIYQPLLEAIGLTYPQYLVLMVLWEYGPQTVNQIGERLYLDSGTLTPLLKRLAEKELISRARRPSDERVVEVSLTTKGKALKKKAECVPAAMFGELGISLKEAEMLKMITNKILQNDKKEKK